MHRDQHRGARLLPLVAIVAASVLSSCGDLSPTTVKNPNLTDDQFLGTTDAGHAWFRGIQRQFLSTLNSMVQGLELQSDNYYNNYTTNSQRFDGPNIIYIDTDIAAMQGSIARLRHVATFGLDSVYPGDTTMTTNEKAETYFFRGMASLFAGESFVGLPSDALTEVVAWEVHVRAAIADLEKARTMTTDVAARNSYTLALARARYRLGERAQAVQEAQALLAANATFIRNAVFDPVNGPTNSMQGVLTSSVNNFQPLPRLDFLDPKYPNRGPTIQSPIAFLKSEEAHLIVAEGLLAENNITAAKDRLKLLLALVQTRTVETVDGTIQKRGRAGGKIIYPNTADTRVAFAPNTDFLTGYVLNRQTTTLRIPTVSGTSVTAARIDAITTVDDGLYVLCLMRQEIFIAEGRRAADLGIRMPVSQSEVIANPKTQDGAEYTKAQIPAFVPGNFELDAFTYDQTARTVVIKNDMNRTIVQNKTSKSVLPLLNKS